MGNVPQSPLLGYNTNVRHDGILFHIQTEDSGVEHPHIITHLFVSGTILGTKKTSYTDNLDDDDVEASIRELMKQQHKAMFIELRDGVHDEITAKRVGGQGEDAEVEDPEVEDSKQDAPAESEATEGVAVPSIIKIQPKKTNTNERVRVVRPAVMVDSSSRRDPAKEAEPELSGRSIFDTPNEDGGFGDALITDKSLDEVILSYLTDDE